MSKSFAMAGLRIGWLATRDRDLLARCAAFKDYTTICSSAPSEILALIGLACPGRRPRPLARHRRRRTSSASTRSSTPGRTASPGSGRAAGSIGFPRLTVPGVAIDDWAAGLVEAEGVLLLPGSQFGFGGNHFRLGFGRTDLPEALERLEAYAQSTLR